MRPNLEPTSEAIPAWDMEAARDRLRISFGWTTRRLPGWAQALVEDYARDLNRRDQAAWQRGKEAAVSEVHRNLSSNAKAAWNNGDVAVSDAITDAMTETVQRARSLACDGGPSTEARGS